MGFNLINIKKKLMKFTNFEEATKAFLYDGVILVGDKVADYLSATANTIAKTFKSIGQVSEGSTSWTGDDLTMEDWKDEAGKIITSKIIPSTFGFELILASVSQANIIKWLGARHITTTFDEDAVVKVGSSVIGTSRIPQQTLPIGILSAGDTNMFMFPKMIVSGGMTLDSGRFVMKLVFKAEEITTTALDTFMNIDEEVAQVEEPPTKQTANAETGIK